MAVPAIDVTHTNDLARLCIQAAKSLRDAREQVIRSFAALDLTRDDGAVGAYMAAELGAPNTGEATKFYEEFASLKGYVESAGANTLGAAVLQFCAKVGA